MIANFHAEAIKRMKGTKLVACFDSYTPAMEKFSAEAGCKGYAKLEDMLADPAVNIVTIGTPSGAHMEPAVAAAKAGDKATSLKWFVATILLGATFAILHLREWFHMFGEGWSLFNNPEGGTVLFGASFFSITGLHLMHVISGVIALVVIAIGYNTDWLDKNHVETTGLYWHFVDLVWMFVFPLMYLMNATR